MTAAITRTGLSSPNQKVKAISPSADLPPGEPPVLEVRSISKSFPVRLGMFAKGTVSAVDDFSLIAQKGTTIGIVGESGCGKSTAARLILGLIEVDGGEIVFEGEDVREINRDTYNRRALRRNLQMVFQDPYSSLNPRASIGELVAFPMKVHDFPRDEIDDRVAQLLESVGLDRSHAAYYPHQMSGGQRQRVNIARALALDPKLIVCDEAVSALDKSVQAQVLELLLEQQRNNGFAYIFISHDLNVVEYVSDVVVVMYLGQVVESCAADRLYENPQHPYTKALLDSVLTLERRNELITTGLEGEIPSPIDPPSGCRFRTRCPEVLPICSEERPPSIITEEGHLVACHLYGDAESNGETPVELSLR